MRHKKGGEIYSYFNVQKNGVYSGFVLGLPFFNKEI